MDIKRLGLGTATGAPGTHPGKRQDDRTENHGAVSDSYLAGQPDKQQAAPLPRVQPGHGPEPKPLGEAPHRTDGPPAKSRNDAPPTVIHQEEPAPTVRPDTPPAAPTTMHRIGNAFLSVIGRGDPAIALEPEVQAIDALEPQMRAMSDTQLKAKTAEFKARLKAGETLDQLLPEAYAAVREMGRRVTGMRAFDVQMMGAISMHQGKIAEMRTGEGKTLTAVFPVYLNALSGEGAHVVTVNETLAQRDSKWMGRIYEAMGLSVGCVLEGMSPEEKKKGYDADVTYTTNTSLGFDYLRDNMARDSSQVVQRKPHFALVDEVDEILIDEARTPLIVSETSEPSKEAYTKFSKIVAGLTPGDDYKVDRKKHSAWLTDEGLDKVEKTLGLDLYEAVDYPMLDAQVRQSQKSGQPVAIEFGSKEEADGYRATLAKRKTDVVNCRPGALPALKPGQVALQYPEAPILSQKKGEKAESGPPATLLKASAFNHMDQVPYLDSALKALTLFQKDKDYIVEDGKVVIVDEFTGRVMDGRRYNDGIHQALEAKEGVEVQREQKTMASITYPNLFKRYDKLAGMSGTAKTEEEEFAKLYGLGVDVIPPNRKSQRKDEGDLIFKTAGEKFTAIADKVQKLYEEGQPVLIGTRSIAVNQYLHQLLSQKGIPHQLLNAKSVKDNTQAENDILALAGKAGMVTIATNMAGRGVDIKPDLVNFKKLTGEAVGLQQEGKRVGVTLTSKTDADSLKLWLDANQVPVAFARPGIKPEQLEPGKVTIIYPDATPSQPAPPDGKPAGPSVILDGKDFPTGGLFVLGTERHESRRIDNQLRGRSGRQGDPGTTQFYISLDDELMRYFGGDRLKGIFTRFGIGAGQALSDKLVDVAISRAQGKVEGLHFEMRENTTKYDKVLNIHRNLVYDERKKILDGYDIKPDLMRWADEKIDKMAADVKVKHGKVNPDDARFLADEVRQFFGIPPEMEPTCLAEDKIDPAQLKLELKAMTKALYYMRESELGTKGMQEFTRDAVLKSIDESWHDHLENMNNLQQGIGWVAMAQQDPQIEYQKRAFDVYNETKQQIEDMTMEEVFKRPLVPDAPAPQITPDMLRSYLQAAQEQLSKAPPALPDPGSATAPGGFLRTALRPPAPEQPKTR